MDILSKIIKVFLGSKADKDRKEILPYVEKIKAIYPSISALLTNALLEFWCKGDSVNLFFRRCGSKAADNNHKNDDEYKEPALEDEPVGLPEP